MKQKLFRMTVFFAVAAVLTALDQWTKRLAVTHLMGKDPFVIWEGVFELLYSENRGAAFGILQGRQGFFLLVAALVFAVSLYVFWKAPTGTKRFFPLELCLTVILAGAAGNLIDRVSQGYVVDFLYFKLIDFPIFNVADCYVTIATAVLFVLCLFYYKEEELDALMPSKKEKNQ